METLFQRIIFFIASTNLTLLRRSATELVVRYAPQDGAQGYEVRARSPVKGFYTRRCNESANICVLGDLPSGTAFTLWLQTCDTYRLKSCFLRANQFPTYTLPDGQIFFAITFHRFFL